MKKLCFLVLIVTLLTSVAYACDDLPQGENVTYSGASIWALTAEYRLAGRKAPDEKLVKLPVQYVAYEFVDGWTSYGMLRAALENQEHCEIRVTHMEDKEIGLSELTNVSITILHQTTSIVESIVKRDAEADVCAKTISRSTIWFNGSYASHIFFLSDSDRFVVGFVGFNGGRDVTPQYAGTFNGELHLGFALGWRDCVPEETPAEPEKPNIEPTKEEPETPVCKPNPAPCKKEDSCSNKPINIEINIGIIVKNCIRFVNSCKEWTKQ